MRYSGTDSPILSIIFGEMEYMPSRVWDRIFQDESLHTKGDDYSSLIAEGTIIQKVLLRNSALV